MKKLSTQKAAYAGAFCCLVTGAIGRVFTSQDAVQTAHIGAMVSLGLAFLALGLLLTPHAT